MTMDEPCLRVDELEQLVSSSIALPAPRFTHLDRCAECRSRLEAAREEAAFCQELRYAERHRSAMDRHAHPTVNGYRIEQELHRGGQGVVYRAVEESSGRVVALKCLSASAFPTSRQRRRFEREVELAAGLDHPNIVTVFHSGETPEGTLFFAMEYIDGHPLDVYARDAGLDGAATMRLFADVAHAVAHAHHRAVIHRDLKPANILVDADGVAHVLDFGIARAVAGDLVHRGVTITEAGEFVGTLAYAAPEQLARGGHSATTSSDVYTLGVILYQLLTDRLPHPLDGSVEEIIGAIVRDDPRRPSALRPGVDTDLDAIVLKCLAKEPERRYASVDALLADVERFLAGRPIEARRGDAWYVLRKTVRRHRVSVAFAASLLLAITIGVSALAVLYQREQASHRTAERMRTRAERVERFLHDALAQANPNEAPRPDVTMRDVLAAAAERVGGDLVADPLVEAAVRHTIGSAYSGLGLFDPAQEHLDRALALREAHLADPSKELVDSLDALGALHLAAGRFPLAVDLMGRAAETAERLYGPLDERTLDVRSNLGVAQRWLGDHEGAEQLQRDVLEARLRIHGKENERVATTYNNLGALFYATKRPAQAEEHYRLGLEIRTRLYGEDHLLVANSLANLAGALRKLGRKDEAEPLLRRVVEIRRRRLPPEHPDLGSALSFLGGLFYDLHRYEESAPLLAEALAIRRRALPPGDGRTANTAAILGVNLLELGRCEEAEPLINSAYRELVAAHGEDGPLSRSLRKHLDRLHERCPDGEGEGPTVAVAHR
jgi:tetratricopeptide (TPR) repeat protein